MYDKIGLHIIDGYNRPLGHAPCITLVNPSPAYVAQVLDETQWKAKIIVRWTDRVWHPDMDAMPQSQQLLFQGQNETVVKTQAEAMRYLEYETNRLQLLHHRGWRGALLVPSVGQYEMDVWEMLRPIERIMRNGDVIVVHEYWTDKDDIYNPWHCGRFLKVPWLRDVPIIVSEIGRDVVEEQGTQGWKLGGISSEEYLEEIELYNRTLLMLYDNVIGGTVFTVGNDAKWSNYDVTDVYQSIRIARDAEMPETPEPPPTGPTCEEVKDDIQGWRKRLMVIEDTLDATRAQVAELRADMLNVSKRMCR